MARNSLIAAPLWAKRYQHKTESFYAIAMIIENTQILHYQGISGYMPVGNSFELPFSG
jgi:hypothetical protein